MSGTPAAPPPAGTRSGIWALADQGVVSLGTFLMNILLARSLPLTDYGNYALLYGLLLVLNRVFAALVVYPLSVKGAAADHEGLGGLTRGALRLALPTAMPVAGALLGAAAWSIGRLESVPWALSAALFWQVQETVRRSLMAHLRHREALVGDAVSYLGQAGIVAALAASSRLSLEAAFAAMAVTSAAAAAVQAAQLRTGTPVSVPAARPLAVEFYRLGRWVLLTSVVTGLTTVAYQWTLVAFHGVGEVAALAAAANVLKVTHPLLLGLGGVILPAVASAVAREGYGGARRAALWHGTRGMALMLPYLVAVFVRPDLALRAFYGAESPYLALELPLRLFAVQYVFILLASVQEALLNGLKKTRATFTAQSAGASVAMVVGLPLAAVGGLPVICAAGALADAVRTWTAHRLAQREGVGLAARLAPGVEATSSHESV